jgi:undecaprenyl diphosphate synthase
VGDAAWTASYCRPPRWRSRRSACGRAGTGRGRPAPHPLCIFIRYWRRPAQEVQSIFWLLRAFLRLETERFRQRDARLEIIGRRDRLAASVLREIDKAECATLIGRRIHVRVAIDYSSRDAITRAAASATAARPTERVLSPELLAPLLMESMNTQTSDVDLLIRTGGEKRLSDFLLWESAYAELLFTDCMWPDFAEADLDAALEEFRRRERRFGGVVANESRSVAATLIDRGV